MTLAHRLTSMTAGRVEQIGAPLEVYARPASTFVAGFIGSPPMNLIPRQRQGRAGLFGIRPEHLEPCPPAEAMPVAQIHLLEPPRAPTPGYRPLAADRGARLAAPLPASFHAHA